jgi:superoxide dismutase
MEIHHKKHHQAYITNYNAAMEQYQEVCCWVHTLL